MAQLPLLGGAYEARGVIANAQACLNLYAEDNPKDAPFPVTHYPAPGLIVLSDFTGLLSGSVRGLYVASDNTAYAVIGQSVIRWLTGGNTAASYYLLGTLPTNSGNPVSMCDNQTDLVIVDGTGGGWYVTLPGAPGSLQTVTDTSWYGSNRVDFIDTFLVFNWPGTPTFYTSTSNVFLPLNPLYFAAKEGWNDYVVCVAALHDNLWVFGNSTTEIWFNAGSGAATFPFMRMPNSVLQQGCVAPYSVLVIDDAVYWFSQDRWGRSMLMRGQGYGARRISNFAVENEWYNYPTVIDCVAMAYQIGGHEIVGLYFPTAQQWWGYDATTGHWHKRTFGGVSAPWLPYCTAFWGNVSWVNEGAGIVAAGDRTAPRILQIADNVYTDAGFPITRQRSWPHAVNDGRRQTYPRFTASFDGSALAPDGVNLDWSDDGGHTFGTPLTQAAQSNPWGQTYANYQWRRLGYSRDRVFRLTWTGQGEAALNGTWVDAIAMAS